MEPREPVVTYNGEDRSEAKLRAVVGACFWCLRHFETIPYSEPRFMPPLRGSHLFLWPFPGVWGFESSLSTPSQAAPYGAPVFASRFARLLRRGRPPPGYFIAPLTGLKFRLPSSLLRSYAEAGAYARKIPPPSPLNFRFIEHGGTYRTSLSGREKRHQGIEGDVEETGVFLIAGERCADGVGRGIFGAIRGQTASA